MERDRGNASLCLQQTDDILSQEAPLKAGLRHLTGAKGTPLYYDKNIHSLKIILLLYTAIFPVGDHFNNQIICYNFGSFHTCSSVHHGPVISHISENSERRSAGGQEAILPPPYAFFVLAKRDFALRCGLLHFHGRVSQAVQPVKFTMLRLNNKAKQQCVAL